MRPSTDCEVDKQHVEHFSHQHPLIAVTLSGWTSYSLACQRIIEGLAYVCWQCKIHHSKIMFRLAKINPTPVSPNTCPHPCKDTLLFQRIPVQRLQPGGLLASPTTVSSVRLTWTFIALHFEHKFGLDISCST